MLIRVINMKYYFHIFLLITFIANFISAIKANSIKVAVLKYGSVNWEYNVIKHHKLDKKNNIKISNHFIYYNPSVLNEENKIIRWILANLFIKKGNSTILPNKRIFFNKREIAT